MEKSIHSRASSVAASGATGEVAADYLQEEYRTVLALYQAQPAMIRQFLDSQARALGEAINQGVPQARFTLPDRVMVDPASAEDGKAGADGHAARVPSQSREQIAGGLLDRLARNDCGQAIRQRLAELEQSSNRAVATSATLLRFATAAHMIHGMLPAGRTVHYETIDGEEIPTVPAGDEFEPESAITATTDAIAEEGGAEAGRGELLVPYVPYARRFYLPQWVILDDQGKLLVKSLNEAEARLASMQRFIDILHAAVALAPYIVVDEDYQRKRYGMLGQLVNQGRALALYENREIIEGIKRRAAARDLNRGLSLSVPYFDDQTLRMNMLDFEVIPAGRIMFVPAFVVRAVRQEQAKVAQDTRLSPSTRKYLLAELKMFEQAFS